MLTTHLSRDYKKVYKVILSCSCQEHLDVANRLITNYYMKWNNDSYLKRLESRYLKKRFDI